MKKKKKKAFRLEFAVSIDSKRKFIENYNKILTTQTLFFPINCSHSTLYCLYLKLHADKSYFGHTSIESMASNTKKKTCNFFTSTIKL